ncbi:MAG: hypothetical protein ACJ79S_04625 [Gemmatimonadaceae bacterium]
MAHGRWATTLWSAATLGALALPACGAEQGGTVERARGVVHAAKARLASRLGGASAEETLPPDLPDVADVLALADAPDQVRAAYGAADSAAKGAPTGAPELPRATVATAMSATPSRGRAIRVAAGGDLQGALDAARPGDQILLAPGATYSGNFVLPRKTRGGGWITVRTSGALPPEGTRMTPRTAGELPKLVTRNQQPALRTAFGAHHYRVIGVEVTGDRSLGMAYDLVRLGQARDGGQRSLGAVPHHIILDRVYVHGGGALDLTRCVALNSAWSAVVDSYLSECHARGRDSQAIGGWNGPGPFRIVNNYLEGAGENVMFGGADPAIAALSPADIEIRHNHFFKPLAWKDSGWVAKNLFELKNAQRLLVEGNVMENSWVNGQDGPAVAIKSTNQEGSAPWSHTGDVTFRDNVVRRAVTGIALAARPEERPVTNPTARVLIANNLFLDLGAPETGGGGTGKVIQLDGDLRDVTIERNTGIGRTNAIVFANGVTKGLRVRGNVFAAAQAPWGNGAWSSADGHGVGIEAWHHHAPDGVNEGNVYVGRLDAKLFPRTNAYPEQLHLVGFADPQKGDYRLLRGSRVLGTAPGRTDPGVNYAALERATRGVAAGGVGRAGTAAAK